MPQHSNFAGRLTTALMTAFLLVLKVSAQEHVSLVTSVSAIGMTVEEMDRSVQFYRDVLAFEKVSDVEVWGESYERLQGVFGARIRIVRMRLGDEHIDLTEYIAPKGKPYPIDTRSNDHWFQHIAIVVSDMDKAYNHLRKYNVRHASTGPQRIPEWNAPAAGIRAFYFRDPDGHFLEVIYFPKGKGDMKWQDSGGKLFLGIDHTAIVVSNTEESLRFYRDLLGLRYAGESENHGTEQEHLNNVFGARLRISGLRAKAGPGIEFLEYLTPGNGRPSPHDLQANDIAHWQTTLGVVSTTDAWKRVRSARMHAVSPGPVTLPDASAGFRTGLLVRDPDGHPVLLIDQQQSHSKQPSSLQE